MIRKKAVWRYPAVLLVSLTCSSCSPAQEPAGLQQDIEQLSELRLRLERAESGGDLEALADIYAPEVLFQVPETALVAGSDAVLALWDVMLANATLEATFSSSELLVHGDSATDRGTVVFFVEPRDDSSTSTDTLHYLLAYQRSATGSWKLQSELYSENPDLELRIPELLPPTGPYRIGTLDLLYVDSARAEILTDDPGDFRTVTAQVWYPARPANGSSPVKYRSAAETRASASFLGWPIFVNSVFALVNTHSYAGADPDLSGTPYPLIVYHHGYGGHTGVHLALVEELASHGFVVASVGHAYESTFLKTPDGELVSFSPENPAYLGRLEEAHGDRQEALKDAVIGAESVEEQARAYRNLLDASPRHQESTRTWAADGRFVVDRLAELSGRKGPLAGMIDDERVGVIGHSIGGAAAGQSVTTDSRVLAAVDMDGFMFGDLLEQPTDAALMLLSARRPGTGVGGSVLTVFRDRSEGPAYLLVIDGFEHGSFTDLPLFAWPGEGGDGDGARALEIQRNYVSEFFGRYLQGTNAPLLDGPSSLYPEVSITSRDQP
jgi:predicted dienelactone hydrolase/ketosteroid isomerase-like protein